MEYNVTFQNLTGNKSFTKNQKRKKKNLTFFFLVVLDSSQLVT